MIVALALAVVLLWVAVLGHIAYSVWDYRASKRVGELTTSTLAATEGAEAAARRLAREARRKR